MCEFVLPGFSLPETSSWREEYRDRRGLLSSSELHKWQSFKNSVKGKLFDLGTKDVTLLKFGSDIHNLGSLTWAEVTNPGIGMILSVLPIRKLNSHGAYDGYCLVVLLGESIYLVDV
ncbi:MAG: hypothetical protein E6R04_02085 [Spirochaetes bacterium]|nr:MAG: hypothetical protein E6R04_02085 [Spirochaetota bacterium]